MLAELAAANAAFSVLKQAVSNGRDLSSCAKQIGSIVTGEEVLRQKLDRKTKSPWYKLAGNQTNDFEEFMALEKIKSQKAELESAIKIYGRGGMWDDWQKFLAESRKSRRMAELKRKEFIDNIIHYTLVTIGMIILIGSFVGLVWFAIYLRNK